MSAGRMLRGACWTLLLSLLVAPTPGAVGSCGSEDDELSESADIRAYCREREELVCVRRQLRGEVSVVQRDDCRRAALERCQGRFWPAACEPTRRETGACLTALRLVDLVDVEVDAIEECNRPALRCADTTQTGGAATAGDAGVTP